LLHGGAESLGTHGVALLSLSHALVVSIEGGVGISNNERLLHRDGSGRRKTVFLIFGTTFLLLAGRLVALPRRHSQVHGLTGELSGSVSLRWRGASVVRVGVSKGTLSSNGRTRLAIIVGLLLLVLLVFLFHLGGLLPLLSSDIENAEVVKLFGKLQNSTEHIHLSITDSGGVATARSRLEGSLFLSTQSPGSVGDIVHPDVIELVVVVVLSSESIEGSVVQYSRVSGTNGDVTSLRAHLSLEGTCLFSGDDTGLVHARTVNESTEDIEVSILLASNGVVVSGDEVTF
jgi:hypothetical protein